MDAMRRSCRVLRLEYIPNTTIRDRMNIENDIIDRIDRKRLIWYGHLKRIVDDGIGYPLKDGGEGEDRDERVNMSG